MIEMEMEPKPGTPEVIQPPSARLPRRLVVALPPAQAEQLRKVAEQTGISQADLLAAIERDEAFGDLVTAILRNLFRGWRESLADSKIFPDARSEER